MFKLLGMVGVVDLSKVFQRKGGKGKGGGPRRERIIGIRRCRQESTKEFG